MSDPPANARLRRRLGAVLFADVANYSRLMGEDEIGNLLAVKARLQVFYKVSALHHGDVLQVSGDGAFLLFDSAVDAVSFALEIQRAMARENTDVEPERAIRFRIGINLGEILFDADEVSGERQHRGADRGAGAAGICLCHRRGVRSDTQQSGGGLRVSRPEDAEEHRRAGGCIPAARGRAAGHHDGRLPAADRRRVKRRADLSAVVLPFKFQGDESGESWLASGMSEDITTSLSRFRNFS